MYQLTAEEFEALKLNLTFQNGISSWGGTCKLPYAFTDQNDINEDIRMQLELINRTLAEMQAQRRADDKPRNPIGFKQPE